MIREGEIQMVPGYSEPVEVIRTEMVAGPDATTDAVLICRTVDGSRVRINLGTVIA